MHGSQATSCTANDVPQKAHTNSAAAVATHTTSKAYAPPKIRCSFVEVPKAAVDALLNSSPSHAAKSVSAPIQAKPHCTQIALCITDFDAIAKSSVGGNGMKRPAGRFNASRNGDGLAVYERVPVDSQARRRNHRRNTEKTAGIGIPHETTVHDQQQQGTPPGLDSEVSVHGLPLLLPTSPKSTQRQTNETMTAAQRDVVELSSDGRYDMHRQVHHGLSTKQNPHHSFMSRSIRTSPARSLSCTELAVTPPVFRRPETTGTFCPLAYCIILVLAYCF